MTDGLMIPNSRWRFWKAVPKSAMIFWLIISALLAFVSGFLSESINTKESILFNWKDIAIRCACIWVGVSLFILTTWLCAKTKVGDLLIPFKDPITSGYLLWSALISMIFSILIAYTEEVLIEGKSSIWQIVHNPGGIFTLFSGVATITGVYLTLVSVLDFRQNITSFPELIDRLCQLISTTDDRDSIYFLAFTPAVGSLSLPQRLSDKLQNTIYLHRSKIKMICLKENDLKDFHNLFKGRRTDRGKVTDDLIKGANNVSENIIQNLRDSRGEVKRISQNKMPGYYMFTNSKRAIIVAPFFMPLPIDALSIETIVDLPTVQMFGIETSDSGIVNKAHQMYDIYKNHVPED